MAQKIQMVDLLGQYEARKQEFDSAISSVITRSAFINGPEVDLFQKELQVYLDVKHAITCANGTDALTIALWALNLEPGAEVITADFTFIATAEAIARVGLVPVLVDVTKDTFTIDIDKIEQAITPKTKVIMPVHLFGQAADMTAIMALAKKYNLFVIEDCAQSFGAEYSFQGQNRKLGTIGHISCTSFFPSKNLGCFGDGGAMYTNDDKIAEKLRKISNHGSLKKYYHSIIGVNSRLDGIQAAVLRVKLKYIDMYNAARKQAAQWYSSRLSKIDWIQVPQFQAHSTHVFHQYTLLLKGVDNYAVQAYLQQQGIPSMIYYPVAMHEQEALQEFAPNECSVSKALTQQVLSLPMHTELTESQVDFICKTLEAYKA